VSLAESPEVSIKNKLDFTFKDLEMDGKFRFLDMTTVKESVRAALDLILNEAYRLRTRKLLLRPEQS